MEGTAASGGSGDTTGSSSPSAGDTGGVQGPKVADLTAKYAHLMGGSENADAGEGSEGESNGDADGSVKPPAEAKVIPPVPYDQFQKSRMALRQERERAARAEAQNALLLSQFESLQAAIQNGGQPPAADEPESDIFKDPEIEALKARVAELADDAQSRKSQALASQMEQEWQSAVQANPHIAAASDLVLTLMRADETLTVAKAVEQILRIAPPPASAPPAKVAPVRQQTPPIRPLPGNGGITTPAVAAPKTFGDISKNLLAKYGGR